MPPGKQGGSILVKGKSMNSTRPIQEEYKPSSLLSKIALCGLLAVAAFFLLTEHRAHVVSLLPYILLLACPLMHLLHHGGHGSHGSHEEHDDHEGHSNAPHLETKQ